MPHEKSSEQFAQCYLLGYEIAGKDDSGDVTLFIGNNRNIAA
jgi:hypothetical protein